MKAIYPILVVICLLTIACTQEVVLVEYNWALISARYLDNDMPIHSTDDLRLTTTRGFQPLAFGEDGTVVLPGLGTSAVSADWNIIDSKIHFIVDSSKYRLYEDPGADLSFLEPGGGGNLQTDTINSAQLVHRLQREAKETMRFYSEPFEYHIRYDTLYMVSDHTTLIAVRDKSLDKLKKILSTRPKRRRL